MARLSGWRQRKSEGNREVVHTSKRQRTTGRHSGCEQGSICDEEPHRRKSGQRQDQSRVEKTRTQENDLLSRKWKDGWIEAWIDRSMEQLRPTSTAGSRAASSEVH